MVQRPEGGGPDASPTILLPPLEEVFPLEDCLQARHQQLAVHAGRGGGREAAQGGGGTMHDMDTEERRR